MLVAVFDRALEPDEVVEQLIALVDHPTVSRPGPARPTDTRWPLAWSHDPPCARHRSGHRLPGVLPAAGAGAPAAGPAGRAQVHRRRGDAGPRRRGRRAPGRMLLLRQPPGHGWRCPPACCNRRRGAGRSARPASCPRRPASGSPRRGCRPAVPNAIVHAKGWVDMVFEAAVPASTTDAGGGRRARSRGRLAPAGRPAAADRADRPAARPTTASGHGRQVPPPMPDDRAVTVARRAGGRVRGGARRRRGHPAAPAHRAACPRRSARSATCRCWTGRWPGWPALGLTGPAGSR